MSYLEQHGAVTIESDICCAQTWIASRQFCIFEVKVMNRVRRRQEAGLEIRCYPGELQREIAIIQNPQLIFQQAKASIRFKFPFRMFISGNPGIAVSHTCTESLPVCPLPGKKRPHPPCSVFAPSKLSKDFRWFVNGKPYFIRGSNYIGSQWLSETLFPEAATSKTHPFGGGAGDDFFTRDVALAKQANLNMLRVHAHVLPHEFHAACDRAGILVWQDFPLQWGYSDEPDFQAEAERQMRQCLRFFITIHPLWPGAVTTKVRGMPPGWPEQLAGRMTPARTAYLDTQSASRSPEKSTLIAMFTLAPAQGMDMLIRAGTRVTGVITGICLVHLLLLNTAHRGCRSRKASSACCPSSVRMPGLPSCYGSKHGSNPAGRSVPRPGFS